MIQRISKSPAVMMLLCALMISAQAQNPTTTAPAAAQETPQAPNPMPPPPATVAANAQAAIQTPPALRMPHHWEPFDAYKSSTVPEPTLTNSPRLDQLMHDGKLYISLKDAIALAIEKPRPEQLMDAVQRADIATVKELLVQGADVNAADDVGATVYHVLGVDPASEVRDRQNRPVQLNRGEVMHNLFRGTAG